MFLVLLTLTIMNKKQFIDLKRRIDKLLQKAEDEALAEGVDITSIKLQEVFRELKGKILAENGIGLEEYETMEKSISKTDNDETGSNFFIKIGEELRKESNDKKQRFDEEIEEIREKSLTKTDALIRDSREQIQSLRDERNADKKELSNKIQALVSELKQQKGDKQTEGLKNMKELEDKFYREAIRKDRDIDEMKSLIKKLPTAKDIDEVKKEIKDIPKPEKQKMPDIKKEIEKGIKDKIEELEEIIDKKIKDAKPEFLAIPSQRTREQVVLEIDLSSQLDGSKTEFSLGRAVKAVILTNLNGTIVPHTLNTAKTSVSLTFAPDTGEELKVITLI